MTENKPLSKITKELYEVLANKTLSFGCKVRLHTPTEDGCPTGVFVLAENEMKYRQHYHTFLWGAGYHIRLTLVEIKERGEILGHEPALNDILLKLGESYYVSFIESKSVGWLFQLWHRNKMGKAILLGYDLTKSFDSQSEEITRKLHSLLITK